jgi:hypothetical protein
LRSINAQPHLLKRIHELHSGERSLNQATAVLVKEQCLLNLSIDGWGGAPIIVQKRHSFPTIVDMHGRPYKLKEIGGKLVLLSDAELREDAVESPRE